MGDHEADQDVEGHSEQTADTGPAVSTQASNSTSTRPARQSRKRTKTGCLTCRRRRIKCGEEKPICDNCIKSKRHCEGYNQRVIFKEPIGAFQISGGLSAHVPAPRASQLPTGATSVAGPSYPRTSTSTGKGQSSLPAIAPRPTPQYQWTSEADLTFSNNFGGSFYQPGELPPVSGPIYQESDLPPRLRQDSAPSQNLSGPPSLSSHGSDHGVYSGRQANSTDHASSFHAEALPDPSLTAYRDMKPYSQPHMHTTPNSLQTNLQTYYPHIGDVDPSSSSVEQYLSEQNVKINHSGRVFPTAQRKEDNFHNYDATESIHTTIGYSQKRTAHSSSKMMSSTSFLKDLGTAQNDVVEEEEFGELPMEREVGSSIVDDSYNSEHKLGLMIAFRAGKDSDAWPRSFHTLLDQPNMLATYAPTLSASPLQDDLTARVFCHFVIATGPTLSIFERHPTNPSVMFSGEPVPSSQQNLWTYTVPTLALRHQALLHAVLALASLHIARLQGTPVWASLKHYHIALRRIGKAHQSPSKRGHIATLAATLILGFYEVMSAEHAKWSSHLLGAKQLLTEFDFLGMTKHIRSQLHQESFQNRTYPTWADDLALDVNSHASYSATSSFHGILQLNEGLISILSGKQLRYNQFGHIVSDFEDENHTEGQEKTYSLSDLDEFATRSDLFWWFCKQDVYQSVISGNKLLLDYDRWTHCPPRGPVGRKDAVYGSMDHLVLILGRIADFTHRDRARKVKVIAANGGQWRPPSWMKMDSRPPGQAGPPKGPDMRGPPGPPPDYQNQGSGGNRQRPPPQTSGGAPSFQGKPMYGMIPPIGPPQMPSWSDGSAPPEKDYFEDPVLETATMEAEQKWNDIKAALRVFEESLGPDFQPLGPDEFTPESTPFGPARRFGSHTIACIWILYYMGCIIMERVHPAMPPAAMMAAGIAAPKTGRYANEVCRIFAAMAVPPNTTQLSPALGAALMESTMGLFFSGVQIQDPFQRVWLVGKLRDITRLTGWQSATAIALGCEAAWTRAAELGRGPPYQRSSDPDAYDRITRIQQEPGIGAPETNIERRFITVSPQARVVWALGLLSLDEDFKSPSSSQS